jgi:N-acetylglucosamine-6-phosphate deacetylase
MVLKDALVFSEKTFMRDVDVRVENGRIVEIGHNLADEAGKTVTLQGNVLLPGLIDVHTHGDFGYSYGDGEESVRAIARLLPQTGTTAVLATLCDYKENMAKAHRAIAYVHDHPKRGESRILGTHFEAPFIALSNLGIIKREFCIPISLDDFDFMVGDRGDLAKMITLSPELDGALEFIRVLTARGVRVSAGHTSATFELMNQAIDAGVSHVTHLFNAMNPLHHRNPGTPCAALCGDVTVELISDGIHLHEGILRLVTQAKQPDLVCLVTDSSVVAGLPDGEYEVDGRVVVLKDGAARLKVEGNLASSALTMDASIRFMMSHTQCPAADIIGMATAVPARQAGLTGRGSIATGNFADFAIMSRDYHPRATVIEGVPVWQAKDFNAFDAVTNQPL